MKEIFDEHLSLILPEGYNLERGTDPQGRTLLNFHPAADAEQEIRLFLRNAGKEAELEEGKRSGNLRKNYVGRELLQYRRSDSA